MLNLYYDVRKGVKENEKRRSVSTPERNYHR